MQVTIKQKPFGYFKITPYLVFIGGASKYFILLQFEIWYLKLNTDKIEPCVRII